MVIQVNGNVISTHDINRESAAFSGGDPQQAQRQAAIALILRTLLLERAQADRELDEVAADATIEALLAREVETPPLTIAACRHYYQANLERFRSPPLIAARHILLAATPVVPAERENARMQAEQLIARLQDAPQRFASLAATHSACPSREQGGLLGQLEPGQTVPELDQVLLRLPAGLATRPVASRYGFHIIDVLERVEGEQLPFANVLPRIRDYLGARTRQRAIHQYLQRLLGEARIEGIELERTETPLMQ